MTTTPPGADHDEADPPGEQRDSHSQRPLVGVDPAPLHRLVDDLAAALHTYVTTATGVRAEFGATEADEDPRVLAVEDQISELNGQLYDLLHSTVGIHAELTGTIWREPGEPPADEPGRSYTEEFHLGFVIALPAEPTGQTEDAALGVIDDGGADLVRRLTEAGFAVQEWGSSQGAPLGFDDDEEDRP